ncbi:MAG: hypothetical protein P8J24_12560 [Arenicellales bacterium]|nr:hypothetical protein [Arenicellales bacterium]
MCCRRLCVDIGYAGRAVNPDFWGSRLSNPQTGPSSGARRVGYFSRSPDRDVNASGAIVGRRQVRHLFQSADGCTHQDHYPFAIGDAFIQFISLTAVVVGGYFKIFANTENSLVVARKVREIYSERQSLLFNFWYTIYQ